MKKKRTFNIQHSTLNIQFPEATEEADSALVLQEGENGRRKFDLEERLLEFTSAIIKLSEALPNSRAGNHVAGQILRSGTAPYANHAEAEAAESRDDFIHKLKICLKELRETRRWARLIDRQGWGKGDSILPFILREVDELVRIFHSSVQTAKRNASVESQARRTGAAT